MKCPACGASNSPGRSSCSSCARPLRTESVEENPKPKYSSWSEKSGQVQPWQKDYTAPPPQAAPEPVSAQNMDPRAMQQYYQGLQQAAIGGNDSGTGASALPPPEASGFTAAGCVPLGLFAFSNGQIALGVLGLLLWWVPFAELIYILIVASKGKEMAWRGRRFRDVHEYEQVMSAWNAWGWGIWALAKVIQLIGMVGGAMDN